MRCSHYQNTKAMLPSCPSAPNHFTLLHLVFAWPFKNQRLTSNLYYRSNSNSKYFHQGPQLHFDCKRFPCNYSLNCYYLFLNNLVRNSLRVTQLFILRISLINSWWRASSVCTAGMNIHRRLFMQFVSCVRVNFSEWVSLVASTYDRKIFMNVFTSELFSENMWGKKPLKIIFCSWRDAVFSLSEGDWLNLHLRKHSEILKV